MSAGVAEAEAPAAGRFYLGYVTALLTLVYFVHAIDRQVIAVLIEPIRREFSLNDAQIGLLTGAVFGISYALMSLPMGMLIDRFNRRNILGISLLVWSAMTCISGFARSFGQMVAARAMVGMFECGSAPACISLASDLHGPRRRGTVFGLFFLGSSTGVTMAAVGGGWLAQEYGWRTAFFVAGLPGIVLAILLFLTMKEPRRGQGDVASEALPQGPASFGLTLKTIWRRPAARLVLTALPLGAAGSSAMSVWLSSFYIRAHGLELRQAGLVLGLVLGIGIGVGAFITGSASDWIGRHSRRRALLFAALCLLLSIPAGWLLLTVSSLAVSIVFLAVWSLVSAAYLAIGLAALANIMPARMRGVTTSMRELLANLIGYGLGPALVGWLSAAQGSGAQGLSQAMFVVTSGAMGLSAIFFALAARTLGREDGVQPLHSSAPDIPAGVSR